MVGLTASELQAETLFPGDTVEYYSMAFVAGDPRGHRLSKVLRVDRKDDEFPIRVDTQEMLPLTIMLKRKRDRNDVEISPEEAKWRKLRTFRLVDGEVEGETRADRLNAGLKKSISDAMKVTKKQLAREKTEKVNAGSKALLSRFFVKETPRGDEGDTTSSQNSSFERHLTPERNPKRKPLTPRDDNDHHSSNKRSFGKIKLKKKNSPLKSPVRDRQHSKYESSKHTSCKRQRSDSTPKQTEPVLRKSQKSISTYFVEPERRKKKRKSLLGKFMDRIEEIEVQKKGVDLEKYLALDAKQQEIKSRMEGESGAVDGDAKSKWSQQRKNYNKTNVKQNTSLRSWLKPLESKRRDELEEISGGNSQVKSESGRYLNLLPEQQKSSKMNRKNMNFIMSNTSHHTKETTNKQPIHTSKREPSLLLKKRGSLGTVSARAPKKPSEWHHRKNFA